MPYIHFTKEQTEQARQTDICDLLRRQGDETKKSGSERVWHDGYDKVTIRGNLCYDKRPLTFKSGVQKVQKYLFCLEKTALNRPFHLRKMSVLMLSFNSIFQILR